MSEQLAKTFIEALRKLESDRDLETISSLYSENSELGNVVTHEKFHGVEGAREFWSNYRNTFNQVQSEFRNQIIVDGRAALEWTSSGSTGEGGEFSYEGVSILEMENGKISRFYAYFDPAKLGRQISENE